MTNLKKIGALLLVLVMMLSLSVSAFAAESLTGGKVGTDAGTALEKSVQIAKALNVTNPDENVINAPAISYTYSIAGVAAGNDITDADSVHVITRTVPATLPKLNNGAAGANATIAWTTSDQVSAAAAGTTTNNTTAGTVNTKYLTVDFSDVEFAQAGVYRYQITETVLASAYTNSGVTRGLNDSAAGDPSAYTEVLYLDVYVRDANPNANPAETGRQIYGYVLCNANNNGLNGASNPTVGLDTKVSTFTTDNYVTSNVTVGKTLNGDTYMNSHDFPFHVAFSGTTVAYTEMKKTDTAGNTADMTAGAATDFVGISNGETVKYIGIPAGTTVSAYETNDVSGTTYASSATVTTTGTNADAKNITWTTTPTQYVAYSEQAYNSNVASVTTTSTATSYTEPFINSLELVSPTGVALRVAPYALMLSAGLVLLFIVRRRNKKAAEA